MATTDEEILDLVERDRETGSGGVDTAAVEEQLLNREILDLVEQQSVGPLNAFARGQNTAIAGFFGAPFDLGAAFARETGLTGLENTIRRRLGMPEVNPDSALLGSEQIKDWMHSVGILTDQDIEIANLPEESRIAFRGGETFNLGLLFSAVPFAAARFGAATAAIRPTARQVGRGNLMPTRTGPIRETVRSRPGSVMVAESGMAAGAAQAAGIAEAMAPGDPGVRLGAELVGSVLNPIGSIFRVGTRTTRELVRALRSMSRSGKEARAAEIIQELVATTGESPGDLVRALQRSGELSDTLTAGQLTNSPALLALEQNLAQRSAKFSGKRQAAYLEGMKSMRRVIDNMIATGDPTLMRAAARMRMRHFDNMLNDRLLNAERRAAEAYAKIGTVSGWNRARASAEAHKILKRAMDEVRKIETELYKAIPRKVQVDTEGLLAATKDVAAQLVKGEGIPFGKAVKDVLKRGREGNATVGDMLLLRNRFREAAREAAADNKFAKARRLHALANGAEADIHAVAEVVPEADAARQFSVLLNDKFSRTFAGEVLERETEGSLRISPEEMLHRALGRGGERGARQFRELEDAAVFAEEATEQAGRPMLFHDAVRNEQEAFLRDVAAQFVRDGRVNPDLLRRFRENNDELLARFPQIRAELQDAESAERLLRRVEQSTRLARKRIEQKAAFARLVEVESPARFVGSRLDGDSPSRDFGQLSRLAHSQGPGTVEGLKTSVLDWARMKAMSDSGAIDFRKLRRTLFDQQGERRPSVMELMKRNEVISERQIDAWKQILDRAMEIEMAMRNPARVDELVPEPDLMFDLAVRMVGANIGGAAATGSAAGTPIVLAGAGSRIFRRLLEDIPVTRTLDILIEASETPKLMATLLQKVKNPQQAEALAVRAAKLLIDTGVVRVLPRDLAQKIRGFVPRRSRGAVDRFQLPRGAAQAALVAPDAQSESILEDQINAIRERR